MKNEIPELIWDSAIAGGWHRQASNAPKDIFPEQLGHYWVWRDERIDWNNLFHSETGIWRAWLLENSNEQNDGTEASDSNLSDESSAYPPYPNRAAWFGKELALREWSVHEFQAQGGPDWKASRKILNGLPVSRSVLEKIVIALSRKKKVMFQDIPQD